jgi:glutamate mutase epsilon subunit
VGKIPEEVVDYTENISCLSDMLRSHAKNLYEDSNMIMREITKAKTLLGSDEVVDCSETQDTLNAVSVRLDKLRDAIRDVFNDTYSLADLARSAYRKSMVDSGLSDTPCAPGGDCI